jgi:hypothetical protein
MQVRVKVGNILMLFGIMMMIHWLFLSMFGEVLVMWKAMLLQLVIMYLIPPIQIIRGDENGPKPPNDN